MTAVTHQKTVADTGLTNAKQQTTHKTSSARLADIKPADFELPELTRSPARGLEYGRSNSPIAPMWVEDTKQTAMIDRLAKQLNELGIVLVAHYYTGPMIQRLAEVSNGFVGDSLAMARFGQQSTAKTLLVCGVRFMGESAKILSPDKRVIMPTLAATCSLALGCPADQFAEFKAQHPDRTVVVYANSSAEVKAQADWVVTSSNALEIVDYLDSQGQKILWAPDRYLGQYIAANTGADLVIWRGSCVVHEEFCANSLEQLKAQYPKAAVLVHPESSPAMTALADVVGSTTRLLNASQSLPNDQFIVATDYGIFYKMQELSPNKLFIKAPTGGNGATCRSCGYCPWMAMNTMEAIDQAIHTMSTADVADATKAVNTTKAAVVNMASAVNVRSAAKTLNTANANKAVNTVGEVQLPADIIARAQVPLQRMVDFTASSSS